MGPCPGTSYFLRVALALRRRSWRRHPCCRFWPHRLSRPEDYESWVVPVFPDDDYYIFLSQDLSFGTFGHPWEASLCAYGERLLEAVERATLAS
ncbi:DUF2716 domain-containing protein [Actinomadura luteofluorescens]|uniref:DUF2716 domain-containing protein n=1 Tax=Actinomadura luteofluorescens TaxID=46163 RepID=UPI003626F431